MAELVYAHDLKSCLARDVGSIPTPGTKKSNVDFLIPESKAMLLPCVGNRKAERSTVTPVTVASCGHEKNFRRKIFTRGRFPTTHP